MRRRTSWIPIGLVLMAMADCLPPARAQDAAGEGGANPNPLSAIDPASLTGFRDRPLFSPSRTRPEAVVEAEPDLQPVLAEPEPPASFNIRLLGVVATPDGRTAHVLDLDDEQRYVLREGEDFRGWTVGVIEPSAIAITREAETQRFTVFRAPGSAPAARDMSKDGPPP